MIVDHDGPGGKAITPNQSLTNADFSFFSMALRAKAQTPELLEGLANIARWYEEIENRPAVKRALDFG